MKIHSSCEIEDFVETHLGKLCVILRSRVLRVVCPHRSATSLLYMFPRNMILRSYTVRDRLVLSVLSADLIAGNMCYIVQIGRCVHLAHAGAMERPLLFGILYKYYKSINTLQL